MSSNVIELKEQLPGNLEVRQQIMAAEQAMRERPDNLGFTAGELEHFFAGGTYTRVLHVPAGMVFTGMIHKFDVTSILAQGRLLVGDEFDGGREILAPAVWISPRGVKRLVKVLEDSIWITVHVDPGVRTEEELRAHFVADSYEEVT